MNNKNKTKKEIKIIFVENEANPPQWAHDLMNESRLIVDHPSTNYREGVAVIKATQWRLKIWLAEKAQHPIAQQVT